MTGTLDLDASSTPSASGGDDGHDLLAGYPAVLTVPEVARLLRRSRSRTYTLIRSGQLRSVRIAGSRRVLRHDLECFLRDAIEL